MKPMPRPATSLRRKPTWWSFQLAAVDRRYREIAPRSACNCAVSAQVPFNFGVQPEVSFAGFTAGTEPQGVRLQVFVPVAQPKGVLQIFGQGL